MKKLLAVMLALMLILSMTACGSDDPPAPEDDGQQVENNDNDNADDDKSTASDSSSKLEAFVAEIGDTYYINMETQEDLDGSGNLVTMQVKSAIKDGKVMSESSYAGQHVITIYKDDTAYVVMPDQKLYMQSAMEEGMMDEALEFTDDIDYSSLTTGTEEIEGVTYNYEEVSMEGLTERYYFDNKGKLTYLGTQEQYIKILDYGTIVDDSWFEIPAGYTEMPAM